MPDGYFKTMRIFPKSLPYFPAPTTTTTFGFTIHSKKLVFQPAQSIEFFVFVIDSTKMTVKINTDKSKTILNILNKTETFLRNFQPKIRDFASVIDTLVPLFPSMSFGKLWYRNLENELKW